MSEFQSKLKTLLPAEELFFDATPGFGRYKPFLEQAIAHPAKMNTRLTEYLIKNLTKEGELILDPMSGSGQTGIVAALLGRNALCVELEEKFCKWQKDAIAKLGSHKTLTHKGQMVSVLGDARKLSDLLKQVDVVVTSPPYAERHSYRNPEKSRALVEKLKQHPNSQIGGSQIHENVSTNPENVGNLPLGSVNAVITSPPYSEGLGHGRGKSTELQKTKKLHLHGAGSYAENPNNIGEIRTHGRINAVITSPPYHDAKSDWDRTSNAAREGESVAYSDEVGKSSRGNIGNIHYYDNGKPLSHKYSRANGKETYLEAMLKVYEEMWKVLREDGLAIIVVKPFIRNKAVVDLPYQTWLLMQKCGFKLTKLFKLRLTQQSFWRILYQKKHPEVDVIAHEYILVCQK